MLGYECSALFDTFYWFTYILLELNDVGVVWSHVQIGTLLWYPHAWQVGCLFWCMNLHYKVTANSMRMFWLQITLVWDSPPRSMVILKKPNSSTVHELSKRMIRWVVLWHLCSSCDVVAFVDIIICWINVPSVLPTWNVMFVEWWKKDSYLKFYLCPRVNVPCSLL